MSEQSGTDREEIVYVRARGSGGNPPRLHTDPDCRYLDMAAQVHEHPRSSYPDAPECGHCESDTGPHGINPHGSSGSPTIQKLEELNPEDVGESLEVLRS